MIPDERPGRELLPVLAAMRRGLDEAIADGRLVTDPPAIEDRLGGVRVLRHLPPGARRGTVVHFHGGAYRIGAPEVVGAYAATIAARAGVEVICPNYRLAPSYPFPAGLNDALAVVEALAGRGRLILAGDSAGGGLAASLTQLCVARRIPLAGLILHSPWLDLTVTSPSYAANAATDPLFSEASAIDAADLYLQGLDPATPLASSLFAEVAGFPPTLISVGTGEVLLDDADRFAAKLEAAGVPVELRRYVGMEHVAVTRNLASPGALDTLEDTVAFVAR